MQIRHPKFKVHPSFKLVEWNARVGPDGPLVWCTVSIPAKLGRHFVGTRRRSLWHRVLFVLVTGDSPH